MATSAPSRRRISNAAAAAVLLASASLLIIGGMAVLRSDGGLPSAPAATLPRPALALQPSNKDPVEPPPEIRFGISKPLPRSPNAFRLATYNTENLFDHVDDPTLSGKNEDKDSAKAENELKGLAAALHSLDADVVALEEIESEQALLWFRDTYLNDLRYTFCASIDAGDPRGIEQSVLSRYPIKGMKNWPDAPLIGTHPERAPDATPGSPLHYHRSPLQVDIEIPANVTGGEPYRFTLLVVHHKSGKSSGYWREAEAVKTAEIVKSLESESLGRNIAVLGDFNAAPTDQSVRTYLAGGLIDLFAARDSASPADRPKFISHESGRTIDYILVNPEMQCEAVANSQFILGTPARPAGVDWRTHPAPVGYGSDHYPVSVDVRWKEGTR